ncbi:MAG: glucosyltransferase domain-containing protein, partial [Lachnospiraceae bacterium]|nr:glucosyltransferase domain-containing protein [Lachnospiraceae bacterium]
LAGFLVHFYMFTNKFYNYFEMNNILTSMSFWKSDTVEQGKWMVPILSSISSIYSMPAVNGVIGLTALSLCAVVICEILKLQSRFWGCIVGLIVMTYPSIASYFSYGVNTDVLCITPLMAVVGVWLIQQKRAISIALGTLLIGLAIGAYQPFFAIAIASVFCILFLEVIEQGMGWKAFLQKVLYYGCILVIGFVIYYVGLKLVIAITGVSLGNYHGINEMTSFTVKGILKGLVYTYLYFLWYFFTLEFTNYPILIVANVILAVALVGMTICHVRDQEKRQKGNIPVSVLMVCLIPLGTNAAPFLMADRVGNGVDRYMMFSILFTYFLMVKLMADAHKPKVFWTQWGMLAAIVIVVISGAYMCNQAYYRMECMTTQTNALLTRVIARMETKEEWNADIPVYLANCEDLFSEELSVDIPEFDRLSQMDGTELRPWYNRDAVAKYMRVCLHFPIQAATEEQIDEINQTIEYQNMGVFPAADSIQMIKDVMVVKINEEVN